MIKKLTKTILLSIIIILPVKAEKLLIFDFSEKELSELDVRKVRGADAKTTYSVGINENGNYLKADAENAASGLGKKIKINLDKINIAPVFPADNVICDVPFFYEMSLSQILR